MTLSRCEVLSNTAPLGGAALCDDESLFSAESTVFADNIATTKNGGVFRLLKESYTALLNATLVDNHSGQLGGVASSPAAAVCSLGMTNCILYGNTATDGDPNFNWNSTGPLSLAYCFTLPAEPGAGNITGDPLLVNYANDNYRLRAASPCVDAGRDAPGILRDLDNTQRPVDGNADGFDEWDMGAYEYLPGDTTPPTIEVATSAGNPHRVLVRFNERVSPASAEKAANYAVDQGIAVTNAIRLQNKQTVALGVTTLVQGRTYNLTIDNVRDLAVPPNQIAPKSTATFTVTDVIGECAKLSADQPSASYWHTNLLSRPYAAPIVVMGPPTQGGDHPCTMRIRDVASTQFQWQFDEWDYKDGVHGGETVGYLVLEAGTYTLPHGGVLDSGCAIANSNDTWIAFERNFSSTPVALSQVTTVHDPKAVSCRQYEVTKAGLATLVQGQESDIAHPDEMISWVAVTQDRFAESGIREVGITPVAVNSNLYPVTFARRHTLASVFLADMQTMNGSDPCDLRCKHFRATNVYVMAEEEQSADDELQHNDEAVGYLLLEPGLLHVRAETFDADGDLIPDQWELSHAMNPESPTGEDGAYGDQDGDGQNNLREYLGDTNPNDSNSILKLTGISTDSSGMRILWEGGTGSCQYLECRDPSFSGAAAWMPIFTNLPPTTVSNWLIDQGATNRSLFYRIKAERL